jgi:putative membrane protein
VRREDRLPLTLLGIDLLALLVSGIQPRDRLTWWMEVAPFLLALPILLATYRRFRFTNLVYVLIAVHACVLFLGGHYTYAEVPLGFWAQRVLGLARNDYDRVGHFFQGFVPALITREVLLRRTPLRPGGWLTLLVLSVCLAFSALYELVEWGAAVTLHQGAEAFLGTQGDPWDTQEDMATCLVGAITSLLLLSRWHDRQLAALAGASGAPRSSLASASG